MKYTHATIALRAGGHVLVIDPGAYTAASADLVAEAGAVLVTHDHPDHFDADILTAALDARPELHVWAPAGVTAVLGERGGQVTTVAAGDRFTADGFDIVTYGGKHAAIHPDIPSMQNVSYLIDGEVYHPGDSYTVPDAPVGTLLLPTSGPWTSLRGAVDFVRAVRPTRAVQIHDIMHSDVGRASTARFIGQLTDIELTTLADGESITV